MGADGQGYLQVPRGPGYSVWGGPTRPDRHSEGAPRRRDVSVHGPDRLVNGSANSNAFKPAASTKCTKIAFDCAPFAPPSCRSFSRGAAGYLAKGSAYTSRNADLGSADT
eukprot:1712791-Rhodomonas_salina.1